MVPIDANRTMVKELGVSSHGEGWHERYGDQEISQFRGAQLICEKWGLSGGPGEVSRWKSHQRAVRAIDEAGSPSRSPRSPAWRTTRRPAGHLVGEASRPQGAGAKAG